jgi:hypothetical protein
MQSVVQHRSISWKALPCKMPAALFAGAATNEISRSRLFPPGALAFDLSDYGDLLNKL